MRSRGFTCGYPHNTRVSTKYLFFADSDGFCGFQPFQPSRPRVFPVPLIYTSHRHKLSFFDGRLDDNNMKGVTTEMIPFASLRLRVKSRTQGRKDARDEKERKSQFMPVSSITRKSRDARKTKECRPRLLQRGGGLLLSTTENVRTGFFSQFPVEAYV